jgi:hypothetical protein
MDEQQKNYRRTCDWCSERIGPTEHVEPHPFKGTGFTFCGADCVEKMSKYLIRAKVQG